MRRDLDGLGKLDGPGDQGGLEDLEDLDDPDDMGDLDELDDRGDQDDAGAMESVTARKALLEHPYLALLYRMAQRILLLLCFCIWREMEISAPLE